MFSCFRLFGQSDQYRDIYEAAHEHRSNDRPNLLRLANKLKDGLSIMTIDVETDNHVDTNNIRVFGGDSEEIATYQDFRSRIDFVEETKGKFVYYCFAFACDLGGWSLEDIGRLGEFFAEFNGLPNQFRFDAKQLASLSSEKLLDFIDALKASSVRKISFLTETGHEQSLDKEFLDNFKKNFPHVKFERGTYPESQASLSHSLMTATKPSPLEIPLLVSAKGLRR